MAKNKIVIAGLLSLLGLGAVLLGIGGASMIPFFLFLPMVGVIVGTAPTLPLLWDPIPDGVPSVIKVVKLVHTADTAIIALGTDFYTTGNDSLAGGSDTNATIVNIPSGYFVEDVGWRVVAAFTASVNIICGDSNDSNGWGVVADIGATTVDTGIYWFTQQRLVTELGSSVKIGATDEGYMQGKLYRHSVDPGAVSPIFVYQDGAVAAAGTIEFYIKYHTAALQMWSSNPQAV